jgi:hypothetical protein
MTARSTEVVGLAPLEYCTVLYHAVQYCTALCNTVLYCTNSTVLYNPVQSTVKHTAVLYNIVQFCTVLRNAVQHCNHNQYSTVLYCTLLFSSTAYNDEQDYAELYCAIHACLLCMHVYCTVYCMCIMYACVL